MTRRKTRRRSLAPKAPRGQRRQGIQFEPYLSWRVWPLGAFGASYPAFLRVCLRVVAPSRLHLTLIHSPQTRVERIPQRVAQQVQREAEDADGYGGGG